MRHLVLLLAACHGGSLEPAVDATADTTIDAPPAGAGAISPRLFGLHVRDDQAPWPDLAFGTSRTLGPPQTTWGRINTAAHAYDWTDIDRWIADAQTHGFDVVFTLTGTPTWASSNPTDATCANFMPPGGCDAPDDVAPDGTGTDQHLRDFIHDLATHAAGTIVYWEVWNEPNLPSGTMWHGTTAQLVRMGKDMAEVVKAIDPSAKIMTPGAASGTAAQFLGDYLAAGGAADTDIIAFHGYTQRPEAIVTQVGDIRAQMAANGVAAAPLWDTEASWGLDWLLPDPDEQRGFLARFYTLHVSLGVERLIWFGWGTGGYDPTTGGHTTGTLWDTADGERPAAAAYRTTEQWLAGATLTTPCAAIGTVWTCGVTRAGVASLVVWDASRKCANGTCQTTTFAAPGFTTATALDGTVTPIGGSVAIGAVPVLLTP
jgi:hypothetical protein